MPRVERPFWSVPENWGRSAHLRQTFAHAAWKAWPPDIRPIYPCSKIFLFFAPVIVVGNSNILFNFADDRNVRIPGGDSMRREHPSLFGRALLAVALMVGFYVLAVGLAAFLLYLPYAEWKYARTLHLRLALLGLLGAGAILWAVLPRFDKFQAPGPRLAPEQHPSLFGEIAGIAAAVGQPMPAEVYLVPEVNAWVSNRGGLMGLGSRRVMGLGLPLLQVLTVSEMRAVLAHEFGHYHGGDTALAPWVYKTRSAIFRTLEQLGDSLLQKPFVWYAKLFLRLTNAVARQQEYAADALAAEVVGPRPLITGLQAVYRAGQAFEPYWDTEVAPLLVAGYRPPLAEGFRAFLATPAVSDNIQENLAREMAEGQADPYDTHPSLKDRIAALENLPSPVAPAPADPPALTLLDNLASLEENLFEVLFGAEKARGFRQISWQETLTQVYLPGWQETVREHARALAGLRLGALPGLVANPEGFLARFDLGQEMSSEEKKGPVSIIMGTAMTVALFGQGCEVTCKIGEPALVRLAEEWVKPFSLMAELASGDMPAERWQELCAKAGFQDLELGPGPEEQETRA